VSEAKPPVDAAAVAGLGRRNVDGVQDDVLPPQGCSRRGTNSANAGCAVGSHLGAEPTRRHVWSSRPATRGVGRPCARNPSRMTPKAGQARNPTFTNMRAPCAQVRHKDSRAGQDEDSFSRHPPRMIRKYAIPPSNSTPRATTTAMARPEISSVSTIRSTT